MFWKKFVELCSSKGKSPNAVCEELGYSNSIATKWKNGSVPRSTTLKKIATYFGVNVEIFQKSAASTSENPMLTSQSESDKKITLNVSEVIFGIESQLKKRTPSNISSDCSESASENDETSFSQQNINADFINELYEKLTEKYTLIQKTTFISTDSGESASDADFINDETPFSGQNSNFIKEQIKMMSRLNPQGQKKAAEYIGDLIGNPNYAVNENIVYVPTAAFDGRFSGENVPYDSTELQKCISDPNCIAEDDDF